LGREFVGGELLGTVVSLLRKREVGDGAVDFSLALRNDFRTRPDVDASQFRIGHLFSASAWPNSAISSGLSTTSKVAPAATFWPRATAIFASRPETRAAMSIRVLSASPWTSNGSGACQVPDRQPDNS
jgi:hypothetical protein